MKLKILEIIVMAIGVIVATIFSYLQWSINAKLAALQEQFLVSYNYNQEKKEFVITNESNLEFSVYGISYSPYSSQSSVQPETVWYNLPLTVSPKEDFPLQDQMIRDYAKKILNTKNTGSLDGVPEVLIGLFIESRGKTYVGDILVEIDIQNNNINNIIIIRKFPIVQFPWERKL